MRKVKIVLASTSPRRRELLRRAGIDFEVVAPRGADERWPEGVAPGAAVERIARAKARSVRASGIVLAADTVVSYAGRILGKPRDREDAFAMLRLLQGTTHEVITGVALVEGARERLFHEVSRVTLGPLTDEEIRRYHAAVDPMDKAGACGIQETAGLLRATVEGSVANVEGLPVERLVEVLDAFMV
jgi:septum formation protein